MEQPGDDNQIAQDDSSKPKITSLELFDVADSHCHLLTSSSAHTDPEIGSFSSEKASSVTWHPHTIVLCGTDPKKDWREIENYSKYAAQPSPLTPLTHHYTPLIKIGFGIHPWFISKDWEETHNALLRLENLLVAHPSAIVGEIGLDALRGPDVEAVQAPILLAQLRLAAKYDRPVSVHCVRAYPLLQRLLGGLGPSLKEAKDQPMLALPLYAPLTALDIPPSIVLHGFSGSAEIAKALLTKIKTLKVPPSPQPTGVSRPVTRVDAGERLFWGLGCRTSLRLKDFRAKILPFLWKTGRVLVESDEFYAVPSASSPCTRPQWGGPPECVAGNVKRVLETLLDVMEEENIIGENHTANSLAVFSETVDTNRGAQEERDKNGLFQVLEGKLQASFDKAFGFPH